MQSVLQFTIIKISDIMTQVPTSEVLKGFPKFLFVSLLLFNIIIGR